MKAKIDSRLVLIAGATVVGAGLALVLARRKSATTAGTTLPLGAVLNPMTIRVDPSGDGHFNSGRIGHVHQGTDFLCRPGQSLYAPFAGKIVREAIPYADDPKWRGLLIRSDDGYESKIFYCLPDAKLVGERVSRGQLIGFCQGISQKYGGAMKDHLHIEVRLNGALLNPETLFTI